MLNIENLAKSYESARKRRREPTTNGVTRVYAISDVTFEVQAGELFTLLGPSGCGKTTTLRSIAGLERPDHGSVQLKDRVLFDSSARINVPVNRRGLGMVFQSYAIWPHMTVFTNVAFPLQIMKGSKRPSKTEIDRRVRAILEVTELEKLADRPATALSGGQQQRLALARAMLTEPDLMLLDEPLSNLDAKLRESMRFELKRLQRDLGLTSIYVTHDQVEALMLSSRIAVMNEGKIEQIGRPRDIYRRPASRFVAEFIGTSNMLLCRAGNRANGMIRLESNQGELWSASELEVPGGSEVLASVRPEGIRFSIDEPVNVVNKWKGRVVARAFMGDASEHLIASGDQEFRVRSDSDVNVAPGTDIYLSIAPEHVTLIPQ